MTRHIKGFIRYLRNSKAVSALEYAILIGVVSVALAGIITAFTDEMEDAVENIGADISGAAAQRARPPAPAN